MNIQFRLRKEHLLLLNRMFVGWDFCEFGSPEIDPKRPYGNSDVLQDMLEILGLKEIKKGVYEFWLFNEKWLLKGEDFYNIDLEDEPELVKKLHNLHRETKTALQICLATQSFKEGLYEADRYKEDWRFVTS